MGRISYDHVPQEEESKLAFTRELEDVPFRRASLTSIDLSSPSQRRRRTCKACLFPFSVVLNLLFFLAILFVLAKPCYFSDRACRYDGSEMAEILIEEQSKQTAQESQRVDVGYAGEGDGTLAGVVQAAMAQVKEKQALERIEKEKAEQADRTKAEAASKEEDVLNLLGDLSGIVPQFGTEKVVFMNDSRYANENMFANEVEYEKVLAQWHEDMPIGRGFVKVANSSQYSYLQRPWQTDFAPGLDGYSIASLHQLHCLYMIMSYTGDLALGRIDAKGYPIEEKKMKQQNKHGKHGHDSHGSKGKGHHFDTESDGDEELELLDRHDLHTDVDLASFRSSLESDVPSDFPGINKRAGHHHDDPEDRARHVTHCFDYLRQSARCAGDATLEGKSSTVDGVTDGWGDTHICKKNSQLLDWVVENRFSDKKGID